MSSTDLVREIRTDDFKQQIAMVIPPTVTTDRFVRIATTAALTNPDIEKLDRNSVLRALVQAAADGLMPDGKEGAIVGRGGKAVWQPMIWGLRRQIADYGWDLQTKAVYAADEFEWVDEPHHRRHRQAAPGVDRGDIVGAYAIATHQDGREKQLFMPWADIAKRRDVAATKNVWNQWPAEMSEKTVGRALVKKLPLAEADRERLLRVFDATQLAPGEAAAQLYGPTSPVEPDTARQPTPGATAAQETVPTDDDEPIVGSEPTIVAEQDSADEEIVAAARDAAMFVVPNGQNRGKTLGEIHQAGEEGQKWLKWALGKITSPDQYRVAVWNFARVYLPDAYEEAVQRQEAQAA